MAIKTHKPVTPSTRNKVSLVRSELTSGVKPEKSLLRKKKRISARGYKGRISVRRRGGGHKRRYRVVDFKRNKYGIEGVVKSIEYDPNRSAFIALIVYKDGEKRYIIATEDMKVGNSVISGPDVRSDDGNSLPLAKINVGSFVHNVEIEPGRGGQVVRSAGAFARLLGRDGSFVTLTFPSGETKRVLGNCYATVGVVSNKDKKNEKSGKAGRSRWLGKRPKVRGVVMNPVDHPMGGGEGRTSGGRHPCSPTAVPSKGYKTRSPKKYSDQFIIRRRKSRR